MPAGFDNILGIHEHALSLQAERTRLLSANLANADTPGFKARDIDFRAALAAAEDGTQGAAPLRLTHVAHVQPEEYLGGNEILYRQPLQASLDGNTVETQVEMAQFTENAMRYLTTLRIVSGRLNTLLSAYRGE
jgi:flagellar basal-body rod protein FlgB